MYSNFYNFYEKKKINKPSNFEPSREYSKEVSRKTIKRLIHFFFKNLIFRIFTTLTKINKLLKGS